MSDKIIKVDGETWKVVSTGAERDGQTYCHLASTQRFTNTRNGKNPAQICDWVDSSLLG